MQARQARSIIYREARVDLLLGKPWESSSGKDTLQMFLWSKHLQCRVQVLHYLSLKLSIDMLIQKSQNAKQEFVPVI